MHEAGADWVALHSLDRFGPGELVVIAARVEMALGIGTESIEYLDWSVSGGYSAELKVAEGVRTRLLEWVAKPDRMEEGIDRVNERFLQLTRARVKMAAGTDRGSPGNFQIDAMWWELETRRKLGIDAQAAVRSATESGAALLGASDIGHLRAGTS